MTASPSPIRVLLLVSNPLDAPISIADDMAALEGIVRDLAVPAEFMVRVAETDAISGLLAQRNRPPFHVLHYLGHGSKPPDAQSGYLIMEDKTGGARELEPFRLHAVLNPTGTPEFELAVLSACHSESVAAAIAASHISPWERWRLLISSTVVGRLFLVTVYPESRPACEDA